MNIRTTGFLGTALAAVAAAACGAAGEPPAPAPRTIAVAPRGTISDDQVTVMTNPADGTTSITLPVPADRAIRAVMAGYQKLGIEVTLVDPPARRVGNPQFTATRTFAGQALSRFVSCGETMTRPRANTDRIHISLVSTVRPAADLTSVVTTRLEAVAVDHQSGNDGATVPCSTTGVLEQRLHEAVWAGATT